MTTALCAAGQLLMGRGNPQGGSQRWRFVYSVISTCRNTAARAVSTMPTFTRHPTVSTYVAHTSNDAIDVIDIARDQYIESMPGLTAVAGALVSEARGLVFSSNRGENTVSVFAPHALRLPENLTQCWLGEDFRVDKCRIHSLRTNARFSGESTRWGQRNGKHI